MYRPFYFRNTSCVGIFTFYTTFNNISGATNIICLNFHGISISFQVRVCKMHAQFPIFPVCVPCAEGEMAAQCFERCFNNSPISTYDKAPSGRGHSPLSGLWCSRWENSGTRLKLNEWLLLKPPDQFSLLSSFTCNRQHHSVQCTAPLFSSHSGGFTLCLCA